MVISEFVKNNKLPGGYVNWSNKNKDRDNLSKDP